MAALPTIQSQIQAIWMKSTSISCFNSNKKRTRLFGRNTNDNFKFRKFKGPMMFPMSTTDIPFFELLRIVTLTFFDRPAARHHSANG